MKLFRQSGCVILLLFCFVACQKEIEVKLPDYAKKLVVEGYVENGEYPIVMLSQSVDYMSNITTDTILKNVLIQNAVVCVTSSKGEKEYLDFRYTDRSPLGFAYVGDSIVGEPNADYYLEIQWNGKKYTSRTSILQPFELDSVWFAYHGVGDSAATIRMLLRDDPAVTNYYQFFVKVHSPTLNDRCWVTSIPVVLDDATFNGQTFNYEIMRGTPSSLFAPAADGDLQETGEYYRMTFRPDDTVEFRYAAIDYNSYRFWASANSDIVFGQNPFLSPTPIVSNIVGDNVLGVWCGYASTTRRLIFGKEQ